ncbi:MAG: hypothetical protein HZA49_10930 [Planctomycetes bacterium]|nr:hypothetical protein [Planctomycetota bacterium]
MLVKLAKYIEPAILALIFIVCILELIKVRSSAEIGKEQERKYHILWMILPFVLLVMIILKLVLF